MWEQFRHGRVSGVANSGVKSHSIRGRATHPAIMTIF